MPASTVPAGQIAHRAADLLSVLERELKKDAPEIAPSTSLSAKPEVMPLLVPEGPLPVPSRRPTRQQSYGSTYSLPDDNGGPHGAVPVVFQAKSDGKRAFRPVGGGHRDDNEEESVQPSHSWASWRSGSSWRTDQSMGFSQLAMAAQQAMALVGRSASSASAGQDSETLSEMAFRTQARSRSAVSDISNVGEDRQQALPVSKPRSSRPGSVSNEAPGKPDVGSWSQLVHQEDDDDDGKGLNPSETPKQEKASLFGRFSKGMFAGSP